MFFQKLPDVRFVVMVMVVFNIFRQSLQKQLCIIFDESHVAGIGKPPAYSKHRLCRSFRRRQAAIFAQDLICHSIQLGMDPLQNRKE